MSRLFSLAALLCAATRVVAQTFSSCNPMNETDCPANVALGTSHYFNWTDSATANIKIWNTTAGNVDFVAHGADFTVSICRFCLGCGPL